VFELVSTAVHSSKQLRPCLITLPPKQPNNRPTDHHRQVPGEAARQAFEQLNQAYRELRDPGKLEELLRKAAASARADRDRREAAATVAERVEMNARLNEKRRELRKEEVGVGGGSKGRG
jgi:hypothetical protein